VTSPHASKQGCHWLPCFSPRYVWSMITKLLNTLQYAIDAWLIVLVKAEAARLPVVTDLCGG
jgi:hypothetical protein